MPGKRMVSILVSIVLAIGMCPIPSFAIVSSSDVMQAANAAATITNETVETPAYSICIPTKYVGNFTCTTLSAEPASDSSEEAWHVKINLESGGEFQVGLFPENKWPAGSVLNGESEIYPGLSVCTSASNATEEQLAIYANWVQLVRPDNRKDINELTVSGVDSEYEYTGSAILPKVSLYDDGVPVSNLVMEYMENLNVGSGTVVVMSPDYKGYKTITFAIKSVKLSDVYIGEIGTESYSGAPVTCDVFLRNLATGADFPRGDYEISYANNDKPGMATITVTGTGNIEGTRSLQFEIKKADVSDATVESVGVQIYDGSAVEPNPRVSIGEWQLRRGIDYKITYHHNDSPGNASLEITGIGDYCSGSKVVPFEIIEAGPTDGPSVNPIDRDYSIENTYVLNVNDVVYTGEPITFPALIVIDGDRDETLVSGTDYNVSYRNNVDAGTAFVVITGEGDYDGKLEESFRINPCDISATSVAVSPSILPTNATSKPSVLVTRGNLRLKEGDDYTLYYPQVVQGTNKVYLYGVGNYTGRAAASYTAEGLDITTSSIRFTGKDSYVYSGKKIQPSFAVYVNGEMLDKSGYSWSYANNVSAGTASVTIVGKTPNVGKVTAEFVIGKAANSLQVKNGSKSLNRKKVKRKSATIAQPIKVSKGKGALTYSAKLTKNLKKHFSVSAKTGKVTVKRGTKPGIYHFTVAVKADGGTNYRSVVKKATATVVVK